MAACSITPQEALNDASCFGCLTPGQIQQVILAILCRIHQTIDPMATCDPNTLLAEANCFNCLTPGQQQLVMIKLLCEVRDNIGISGGGAAGAGCVMCGLVDPTEDITGQCDCALFINVVSGSLWYWRPSTSSWVMLIGP